MNTESSDAPSQRRLRRRRRLVAGAVLAAIVGVFATGVPAAAADPVATPGGAGPEKGLVSSPAPTTPGVVIPNIVGGQPASEPYPFEGTLLLDRGTGPSFHCGLTLVAIKDGKSYFLTGAHCATPFGSSERFDPSVLRVTLGNPLRSLQKTYPVSQVEIPSFWSWGPAQGPRGEQGDIAVITVPTRVPATPLMIAPSWIGDALRGIGWGLTVSPMPNGPPLPDMLQQLDLRQIAGHRCAKANPGIATGELCAENPNGAGFCFGDSGSAGLRKLFGRWLLVGTASRGVRDEEGICGGHNNPGIMTAVWHYLPWIAHMILGPQGTKRAAVQPLPADVSQLLPQATAGDRELLRLAYALAS